MLIYFYVWLRCLHWIRFSRWIFFFFTFLQSLRICARKCCCCIELDALSQSIFMMSCVRFISLSVDVLAWICFKLLLIHLLRVKFISLIFLPVVFVVRQAVFCCLDFWTFFLKLTNNEQNAKIILAGNSSTMNLKKFDNAILFPFLHVNDD